MEHLLIKSPAASLIKIGNAPCFWGVEYAGNTRNLSRQSVLSDCAEAGYESIELGPVGYMRAGLEIWQN